MSKSKTIIYSLIVMALWGLLFPLVKRGYSAYQVTTVADIVLFVGIRFAICGAAITAFSAMREPKSFRPVMKNILPILSIGFFAIILHYTFNYCALLFGESSKSAILKQFGSIIYVCFSFLFFKDDKVTVKKIIGVVLGFVGIIVINISGSGFGFSLADFLIILASVCIMAANIISKKTFAKVSPIVATGVSQLFGGVVLVIAGVIFGGKVNYFGGSEQWVLVLIIIASIFSYCLWYISVSKAKLSNLYILKFTEPLFACIFSALLVGENVLRIEYALSFLLIAGGIWISNK